jgi:hypothetical protein
MLTALRRVLSHKLSVATIIEIALWLAIPHAVIGMGWAYTHSDYVAQRAKQLSNVLPAGIDTKLVAIGETTVWWPILALLPPDLCTAAASGGAGGGSTILRVPDPVGGILVHQA